MLRWVLVLALVIAAAVACGGDDDDGGSPTATASPDASVSPTPADSGAASPTLSDEFIFIQVGVRAREVELPEPVPGGLFAVTGLIEFQLDDPAMPVSIGLHVTDPDKEGIGLAWWTYDDAEWQKLDNEAKVEGGAEPGTGIVTGDFEPLPQFLIALVEG